MMNHKLEKCQSKPWEKSKSKSHTNILKTKNLKADAELEQCIAYIEKCKPNPDFYNDKYIAGGTSRSYTNQANSVERKIQVKDFIGSNFGHQMALLA